MKKSTSVLIWSFLTAFNGYCAYADWPHPLVVLSIALCLFSIYNLIRHIKAA